MKSDLIELTVHLIGETAMAWRVDDGSKKVWIPKSKAELEKKGPVYILTLPTWLAANEGLIWVSLSS